MGFSIFFIALTKKIHIYDVWFSHTNKQPKSFSFYPLTTHCPNNEWSFVFAQANRIAYTSDESLKGGSGLKSKKEQVYDMLKEQQKKLTASELAAIAAMDRTNASRYLNELVKDQLVAKDESRLVTRSS